MLLEAVEIANGLVEGFPVMAGSWKARHGAAAEQVTVPPLRVPDDWIANMCPLTPVTFT